MTMRYVRTMKCQSLTLVEWMDGDPLVRRIITGRASREQYLAFLCSTYHYLRWSGSLLAAGAVDLRESGHYPQLWDILDAQTNEQALSSRFLLDDIKALGADAELVKASAAPSAIHAYVHKTWVMSQRSLTAFLGATYTLTFVSMHLAKTAAENLRARGQIPNIENAVSFLDAQGNAYARRIAQWNDILRQIDDPHEQAAILQSAATIRALYPQFFFQRETRAITTSLPARLNLRLN